MPGPEGFVTELFVKSSARGYGVGAALLEAVIAEGKRRGCTRLSLLNNRHRESYQRGFYHKQGWQERGDLVNFIYPLGETG
jgi:GNAT superfamily N-acetyltransferase